MKFGIYDDKQLAEHNADGKPCQKELLSNATSDFAKAIANRVYMHRIYMEIGCDESYDEAWKSHFEFVLKRHDYKVALGL